MNRSSAAAPPSTTLRALLAGLVAALAIAAVAALGLSGTDAPVGGTAAGQGTADQLAVDDGPTTTSTWYRPTTTTTVLPALPVPEALPANAHAPTPQIQLGTLELPTLDVVGHLQEGMTLTAINRGPSHWPGTALPGDYGNVVVAGHRTTYSRPFARLDELRPGDPVVFRMRDGETHYYAVRDVIVVPEGAIGIAAQLPGHTATLFACHPRGSATHRIVAKLALLGPDGLPVDDEGALPPIDLGLRPGDDVLAVRDPANPAPLTDPLAITGAEQELADGGSGGSDELADAAR